MRESFDRSMKQDVIVDISDSNRIVQDFDDTSDSKGILVAGTKTAALVHTYRTWSL